MSSLGAQRIASSQTSIPEYGTAHCDAVLAKGSVPAVGPALLTLATLALAGTIIFADEDAPDLPHAVWVNGAGWDLSLPGRSYGTDAGIRLRTILTDLIVDVSAAAVAQGYAPEFFAAQPVDVPVERLDLRPDGTTGREVLATLRRARLVPPWWVDGAGATNFGPRPGGPATGRNDITRRNAGVGLRVLGCDTPAGFLPGTTLEGAVTRRIVVKERGSALTVEAWSRAAPSLRDSVAAIARRDMPEARYAIPRTFVVRSVGADGRLDLDPPPDAPDLRPLDKVEQWSLGGALAFPTKGTAVLVMFRDAREGRAVVVGVAPGTPLKVTVSAATEIDLGAAAASVVRYGESATLGSAAGVLTFVPAVAPFDVKSKVKA